MATAYRVARAVEKQVLLERGWKLLFHLGDYEAGVETITFEIAEDSPEKPCCWNAVMDCELQIHSLLNDSMSCSLRYFPPNDRNTCPKHPDREV